MTDSKTKKLPLSAADQELNAKLEKAFVARFGREPIVSIPGGRLPIDRDAFDVYAFILKDAPACHGITRYEDGVVLWVEM